MQPGREYIYGIKLRRNLLMLALLLACGRLRHTAQRIGRKQR